jgi:hypothetical protein
VDREAFADVHSEHDPFREILQLYIQALFSQISQQVACNALHSIEERCSRWLLLTHDRVHSDSFPLTQEFLSQMLGVRRASVTLAAGALQTAGLIRYRRGQMVIQDREGLENASCECYAVLRNEYVRLFGPAADPTNEATPRPRHDAMRIPRRPNQRVASQSVRLLSFAI